MKNATGAGAIRHNPHLEPYAVPSRRYLVVARALALVTLVCGVGGCGDDSSSSMAPTPTAPAPTPEPEPTPPPEPESELNRSVTSVMVDERLGQWRTEPFPAESGGPSINVIGNSSIINGGATELLVEGTGLTAIVIGDRQGRGYYELQLGPAASSSAGVHGSPSNLVWARVLVRLLFSTVVPSPLELWLAGVGGAVDGVGSPNAVGEAVRYSYRVVEVGTGDLQVNLSWDTDADLDLHVVEPSGERINWWSRRSSTGGVLDLDSNAGCRIDGVRNENITWGNGAPRGSFRVFVGYYSDCGVPSTNYIVRINCGGDGRLETGTFVAPSRRQRREVATFSCP